jgi:hypothetical protein
MTRSPKAAETMVAVQTQPLGGPGLQGSVKFIREGGDLIPGLKTRNPPISDSFILCLFAMAEKGSMGKKCLFGVGDWYA